MWTAPENGQFGDEIYLEGERVPAGAYRLIGDQRVVVFNQPATLPPGVTSGIACYRRALMPHANLTRVVSKPIIHAHR